MFVIWKFYTGDKGRKESKTKENVWFLTLYKTCKVQVETLSVTISCQIWSGAKVISRTDDSVRHHSRSQILADNPSSSFAFLKTYFFSRGLAHWSASEQYTLL